jgi:hypothetical protein
MQLRVVIREVTPNNRVVFDPVQEDLTADRDAGGGDHPNLSMGRQDMGLSLIVDNPDLKDEFTVGREFDLTFEPVDAGAATSDRKPHRFSRRTPPPAPSGSTGRGVVGNPTPGPGPTGAAARATQTPRASATNQSIGEQAPDEPTPLGEPR